MDEEMIRNFWAENNIYNKVKQLKRKKKFYFLDGPPYATGSIHIGTAWNKILKDLYIRFFRMFGYDVWDQPGYDTHGLPIENKIEKKLEIKSKNDIERLGIEKFILECKDFATKFIDVMNKQFENLGVWMDWNNPYLTLTNDYIEGAWHTFKIAYENGLLYRGLYPVHVCPRCETAVAYNEIEYTKLTDPSIYVKFPVENKENEFLVIWTTTPWTLPGNTGIMAKPDAEYVRVKVDNQILIIAKDLLEEVMKKIDCVDYKIIEIIKGKDMEGLKYRYPLDDIFQFQKNLENAHRVVLSDQFVTLDTGTGLVHTAPGHGQEDYKVGLENKLPVISPVNLNGTFNKECGEYAGIFVKSADKKIINELKNRGLLLHEETITHDYPQCWRCNTPLLQISVPQWFFKITKIRNKLIKENKKVNWYPEWAKQRFENWLENLGDWPISRQRYWGIPLPIWVCECGKIKIIGSADELGKKIKDLHRPYIDEIEFKCECGKNMKRIPDVLDVWFDSGLASWASLGYPKTKDLFNKLWPADLNIEGSDQIRGWWNSQLITSVITFDKSPFKNIVFHGLILDAHGSKMSKSLGNIVTPEEVIKKYSRDVLRFYLISYPPWNDFYFNWTEAEEVYKFFIIMENAFNFVK
ncbi:MAG: isoleucine--tRNA ligase, partial [Candidatus Aenigmatarchaeota archaeon]